MDDVLATVDRLMQVIDRQSEINEANLNALHGLNALDDKRAADIDELREGLAALSNRLEAVTQAVAAAGVAGLHSVKA